MLQIQGPSPLPLLTSNLHLEGELEPFPGDSISGNAVSDGKGKISTGWGKRDQVLAAFGPDNRAALIRQKLGDPDRVIHEREGVLWVYDRYQLTIDTHPKFAWYFRLGSGEWK